MIIFIGEIRGIKSRKVQKDGKEYNFVSLMVEDEEFTSHEISLGRDQESEEFQNGLNKLQGKTCSIPIYIRKYNSKAGSGFSFNFSGTTLPKVYTGTTTISAAS